MLLAPVVVLAACSIAVGPDEPAAHPPTHDLSADPVDAGRAQSPDPSTAVVVDGPAGTQVRYPADAFPAGEEPDLQVHTDALTPFTEDFAIPAAAGAAADGAGGATTGDTSGFGDAAPADGAAVTVLDVTAPSQPQTPVEVVIPFELGPEHADSLAAGAVPLVFYWDEDLELGLPIPTRVDDVNGVLVGTTEHFTDFLAALSGFVDGVGQVVSWSAYQVAGFTGSRTSEPECSGTQPPWTLSVGTYEDDVFGLNLPLYVCSGAPAGGPEPAEQLDVTVALNRGYSLEMSSSEVPAGFQLEPVTDVDSAVYGALARQLSTADGGTEILPARAHGVFTFDRPVDAEQITIEGRATLRTALLDAAFTVLQLAAGKVDSEVLDTVEALGCVMDLTSTSLSYGQDFDADRFVATWANLGRDCLQPALERAGLGHKLPALLKALEAPVVLGRGGQSVVDSAFAIGQTGSYTVTVVTQPPAQPIGDLTGVWYGAAEGDQDWYDVELTFDRSGVPGDWDADIRYPNYYGTGQDLCGGTLTATGMSGDGTTLFFEERIEWEDAAPCVLEGTVTLSRTGEETLLWTYDSGSTAVHATLTRRPGGATALYELRSSGGYGDSGQPVVATLDGRVPTDSTVQWVSCRDGPNGSTFELDGDYARLSGTFALQDAAPDDLRVEFEVRAGSADGEVLAQADLSRADRVPFDVPVSGLEEVTITAVRTAGSCGSESTGYGVLQRAYVTP